MSPDGLDGIGAAFGLADHGQQAEIEHGFGELVHAGGGGRTGRANDFPHHEGSWPYSAQAIERTMGDLTDEERAKILGLNSARIFGFEIPKRYLGHDDAAAVAAEVAARG